MRILLSIGIFSLFLQAQMLFVVDKSDYAVLVEDPILYYSSKTGSNLNMFYKPDIEKKGIRIRQGMGTLLVPWDKIDTLEIPADEKDKNATAVLSYKSNRLSIDIEPFIGGLEAKTKLGSYSIDFDNISRLEVVSENHMRGILVSVAQYQFMSKTVLPSELKTYDEDKLLTFAASKLDLKKEELGITNFAQYTIIHYEDPEYEAEHPQWGIRKFGEAVVIDRTKSDYVAFRLSKT